MVTMTDEPRHADEYTHETGIEQHSRHVPHVPHVIKQRDRLHGPVEAQSVGAQQHPEVDCGQEVEGHGAGEDGVCVRGGVV